MTLLFWFAFLSFISISLGAKGFKCSMSRLDAVKCSKSLTLIGDRDVTFPTEIEDVEQICSRMSMGVSCLANYVYCVRGMKRGILRSYITNAKEETNHNYCSPLTRHRILAFSSCMQGATATQFHDCADRLLAMALYIRDEVETQLQLPSICCSLNYIRNCVLNLIRNECFHTISQEAQNYIEEVMIRTIQGFGLSCHQNFTSIGKCRKNLPTISPTLDRISRTHDLEPQHNNSLIFLFMDIVTKSK